MGASTPMGSFALLDVVAPYLMAGSAIGDPWHELLSGLFVQTVETAFDDNGVVIQGMARFSAELRSNPVTYTPPFGFSWSGKAKVDHRTQRHAGAFWDVPDIAITFRLTTARASSPVVDLVVNGGPGGAPAPLSSAAVRTVLASLGQGQPAAGTPAADAPTTAFHLDLLLDAATLHLPFLTPARLGADGMLSVDPTISEVTLTLPKIKLSLEHTPGAVVGAVATDPQLTVSLDSWAAHDIDDPSGMGSAELLRMTPPYALIGPGDVLGFGFNSVILDLSGGATPPELLAKFGVGDDFRGVYLPDVRVFTRVPGLAGLSLDVSARELLIGLGPEGGVSGIFGLDVALPDAPQAGAITIYTPGGDLIKRVEIPDAPPGGPAAPWTSEAITVPPRSQWLAHVTGGQPPYNITIDGTVQTTEAVWVTLAPGTTARTVPIAIADVHAGGQTRMVTVPIVLTGAALAGSGGQLGGARPMNAPVVIAAAEPGYSIAVVDAPTVEKVTLIFSPPNDVAAQLGATPLVVTNGRATADLKHGQEFDVSATWTVAAVPAATPLTLSAQFQYMQPLDVPNKTPQDPDDPAWTAFAADPSNIRVPPIQSEDTANPYGGWTGDDHALLGSDDLARFVAEAKKDPGKTITLAGMASKEKIPLQPYNHDLSQRRIWALKALLAGQGVTNPIASQPRGEQPPDPAPYYQPGRGSFRRVEASILTGGAAGHATTGQIHLKRPPRDVTPTPQTIVPRAPVGNDSLRFKQAHLRVQIDHNRLIALEIKVQIDVTTALESYLSKVKLANPGQVAADGQGATRLPIGKRADPNDGVLDMRVQVTLDDTVDRWQVVASLFETDKDGFLQTPAPTAMGPSSAAEQYWRTFFGTMIAITPLVDASASANTPAGDLVALALDVGIPFAAVQLGAVTVQRITVYGGELTVTHDASGIVGSLLVDVEVALLVKLPPVIEPKPDDPITVRYKAIGFRTSSAPQIRDLVPVFDSSKGYTLNVPSGAGVKVPAPLGDILQIAGTRIARSNPVNLELDLEIKADLGVVSVDRTTIRIPLEGGHAPTISALGVHLNIPGAIEGHGYLAIFDNGFAGQIDASLPGLGVKVAAGLSVRHVVDPGNPAHTATALLLTLEVDFPVPIALGNSGLGLYGFGGLFALHHRRDEHPTDPVPALDWLERVHGNPMDITGWTPDIDRWAIGLGALLGTMDAGFTLNVKGMLVIELPGPRILLVMKANLLRPRPSRQGTVSATILAVIDIDLGRGRITIGLTFDYDVDPLLRIHVPVRAIFPFQDLRHFAIDAGTYYMPATVDFFHLFTARGYFMIRGRGIPDLGPDGYDVGHPAPFPALGGFSIATGVAASYVWGNRDIGLYLSVGSSIDIALGFSPIMFNGSLKVWGELHLFIAGIEASAQLTVTAGQVPSGPALPDPDHPGQFVQPTKNLVLIDGEVHGEIDLFFFTISGSVHVTLGDRPTSPPTPPKLVRGVSIQSRAAALLNGINSDRPIDGKLTDAHENAAAIPDAEAVPIDSIVVVHFDCTPRIGPGASLTVSQAGGGAPTTVAITTPSGPAAPAIRRGEPYFTYRVTGITLDHDLTAGDVPIVWWPGQPKPDSESKRELALLSRVPDPHPSAVERSRHREDNLRETWSTVCDQIAPPTSVLWTFHATPLGPSAVGWIVDGLAWPDPPGSQRSAPPRLRLDIAETWRTGSSLADLLRDIVPARVVGGAVQCEGPCQPPPDPFAGVFGPALPRGMCPAHVLEAPFERPANIELIQSHPLGGVLSALLAASAQERTEKLDDILAFSTGPIVRVRMLLLVPRIVLARTALVLRSFGSDGRVLDEIPIDGAGGSSRRVASAADLPTTWTDPTGPWSCGVSEALAYMATQIAAARESFELILVDTDVKRGTTYVQTGLRDVQGLVGQGLGQPSYVVGVVETLTAAEVERHDTDQLIQTHKVQTLNGALKGITNPPALLKPSTTYTVRVAYDWATCNADGSGVGAWTGDAQEFHFRTDAQPLAPRTLTPPGGGSPIALPVRLDPWVMLTDPDEGEHFYFWGKPIRVVFSVDYLLEMYAAYGVKLRAIVRSASYANSNPALPGFSKTMAALTAADAKPLVGSAVLSPWEDTVRNVIAGAPCIDARGDISRHKLLDLNLLLAPRTDYILDLEPADPAAVVPGAPARPLFRRAFTTSRYHDLDALCADVSSAEVHEMPCSPADIAALEGLASAVGPISGATLDAALRGAGLRPVVEVTAPQIDVVWVAMAGGLQPRALVIRTPEPLVRTRREPEKYAPPGVPRLQREIVHLVDKPYLEVIQTPAIAGAPVMRLVARPGMNTIVAIVDAGRNAPIDLSLVQHANALLGEGTTISTVGLLRMTLDAAPWEKA